MQYKDSLFSHPTPPSTYKCRCYICARSFGSIRLSSCKSKPWPDSFIKTCIQSKNVKNIIHWKSSDLWCSYLVLRQRSLRYHRDLSFTLENCLKISMTYQIHNIFWNPETIKILIMKPVNQNQYIWCLWDLNPESSIILLLLLTSMKQSLRNRLCDSECSVSPFHPKNLRGSDPFLVYPPWREI